MRLADTSVYGRGRRDVIYRNVENVADSEPAPLDAPLWLHGQIPSLAVFFVFFVFVYFCYIFSYFYTTFFIYTSAINTCLTP